MPKVIVIGAGLGGLSAACRLAQNGHEVHVYERNDSFGGKVNQIKADGFTFDTGASLVTMKHVFEDLFESCGKDINEYSWTFERLDPICRYFWKDGTEFDAAASVEKTKLNIAEISSKDADGFEEYLASSRQKYEISERTFLAKSLNELPSLLRPSYLPDLLKISTLSNLDKFNSKHFESPKMRQLFNRFATYNGSSPYKTPATFALIPWVEFGLGAWYPKGGIYEIPKAIKSLADNLGVAFHFGESVNKIVVEGAVTKGIETSNGFVEADIVVSNADAISAYRDLIPESERRIYNEKKLSKIEPSCSGFVLLLGTNKKFESIAHHNIYFSDDYPSEFEGIFETGELPSDPTIYVCATSRTDATQAPEGGENFFVLINAPYTRVKSLDYENYGEFIVDELEKRGLSGLRESLVFKKMITPEDFEEKYRANRGSIYGVSSNGIMSAFMRVPNMAKDIKGLYFVGGTTHPGGGMPLVLLGGKMVADLIGE